MGGHGKGDDARPGDAPPAAGQEGRRPPHQGGGAETPVPEPTLETPDYSRLRSEPYAEEDIAYQVHIFKCIQSKTQRSIDKTYGGSASGAHDNFISTLREYLLLWSATDNLSLMPPWDTSRT